MTLRLIIFNPPPSLSQQNYFFLEVLQESVDAGANPEAGFTFHYWHTWSQLKAVPSPFPPNAVYPSRRVRRF